jgi:membrane-associated phospholipid phosphatase
VTSLAKRHLHPAVVHLLLASFSAMCFAFVAINVADNSRLTSFDVQFAPRIYNYAVQHADVWNAAMAITDLGSGRPRTAVVLTVTIMLILHRQWRLALFFAATQWLLREVVAVAKDFFERPRPQWETTSYVAGGWSFPSGHATGAMVTYGTIAFLVAWRWPGKWYTWFAIVGLSAIIIIVGFTRMLLGVHWFTDILGGYLLGLTWVSVCVAVIEWQRAKTSGLQLSS